MGGQIRRGWSWRFWGAPIFCPEVPKPFKNRCFGPLDWKAGRPKNARSYHDGSDSGLWGLHFSQLLGGHTIATSVDALSGPRLPLAVRPRLPSMSDSRSNEVHKKATQLLRIVDANGDGKLDLALLPLYIMNCTERGWFRSNVVFRDFISWFMWFAVFFFNFQEGLGLRKKINPHSMSWLSWFSWLPVWKSLFSQMRHATRDQGGLRCMWQLLARTVLVRSGQCTSYCHPGRHANVGTCPRLPGTNNRALGRHVCGTKWPRQTLKIRSGKTRDVPPENEVLMFSLHVLIGSSILSKP